MSRMKLPPPGQDEETVIQALDLHANYLMALPHVVGTGIREAGGEGRYAVAIYIDAAPDPSRPDEDALPESLAVQLPEKGKKTIYVPTLIEEIGTLELESPPASSALPTYHPRRSGLGVSGPRLLQWAIAALMLTGSWAMARRRYATE